MANQAMDNASSPSASNNSESSKVQQTISSIQATHGKMLDRDKCKILSNSYNPGTPNNQNKTHNNMQFLLKNMKVKLSTNLEHYSNAILPVLFRRQDQRARSRSRSRSRDSDSRKSYSGHTTAPNENSDINEEFEFVENIELNHMDGFVFDSNREIGRGHNFQSVQLATPTWCDKCGDFIWGVYKQCLTCQNCQYTCHHKCRQLVTLDCASVSPNDKQLDKHRNQSETSLSGDASQLDDTDSGYHTRESTIQTALQPSEWIPSLEDLRKQIEAFNYNNHGLVMTMKDGADTFQGFIRVYMNLMRPINMSLSPRPTSIYDVIGDDTLPSDNENSMTTSFFLPKDTTKVIHIRSDTTAQDVIRALLHKFKITDNPHKFAVYEKIIEPGKAVIKRRLADDEKPLTLCLSWTAEGLETRRFILQENDIGEVMWEAFSVPELENFLRILDKEEEEYLEQVHAKYQLLKIQMAQRIKQMEKEKWPDNDTRKPVFV